MIIYDLSCDQEHRFEGWFRSAEDFSRQQEGCLLTCPVCSSQRIEKIPSGGHIVHRTGSAPGTPAQAEHRAPAPSGPTVPAVTPQQVLRELVNAVIRHSEDVGSEFAAEARKIHYAEAPARAIRGQASADEYEALQDEGIDVLRLPVPDDDLSH